MPQILKTKCIVNFRKYRSNFRNLVEKKMTKSNKIKKTEDLKAGC